MLLILLFVPLFLISACSKQETADGKEERIAFDSSVEDYTRAVSTFGPITLSTLQGSADGFAVSTSGLGSNMNNLVVKYGSGKWSYTGDYFWPLNPNQNVSFTAYAPAGTPGVTMTSSGISVSGFTPASSPSSQIDLIYAKPANFNRTGAGTGGVALTFDHLLTQIVFSVTTQIVGLVTLTSMELTVPNPTGSYNGVSWTNSGSTIKYTIPVDSPISVLPVVTSPVLMVPKGSIPAGTIATANYTVPLLGALSISKDLSVLTSVKSWQPGYKVTYNSILGLTRSGAPEVEVVVTEEYGFE